MLDNVPKVKEACSENRCMFGTVDSWLIYVFLCIYFILQNLTGGIHGGRHITDVTNASRTLLFSLKESCWDDELCEFFGVPKAILPTIVSSAEEYGRVSSGVFADVPICGCLGDQQAALVGQMCFHPGEVKNTFSLFFSFSFLFFSFSFSIYLLLFSFFLINFIE